MTENKDKINLFRLESKVQILENLMSTLQDEQGRISEILPSLKRTEAHYEILKEQFSEMKDTFSHNFNRIEKKLNKLDHDQIKLDAEKKIKSVMLSWIFKYIPLITLLIFLVLVGIFNITHKTTLEKVHPATKQLATLAYNVTK